MSSNQSGLYDPYVSRGEQAQGDAGASRTGQLQSRIQSRLRMMRISKRIGVSATHSGLAGKMRNWFPDRTTSLVILEVDRLGCRDYHLPINRPLHAPPEKLFSAQRHAEIDRAVSQMQQNITKVSERGERLDTLQDKTDSLATQANGFRRGANRVRKQMWWKDMKMRMCIIVGIIILLVVIIVPSASQQVRYMITERSPRDYLWKTSQT
ncbi:hypothetical protein D0866_15436 [Hortaea werneckii]|uniref:V-SNARE coiled-coil homology domain-containing protein n=1 Tax=Hortaea werneckii TaxID=91943 RepID=A0A3M6YLM2_HORWE|nr:hypothetical protein D0866_15436 [Hortaea werneckii]